MKTRQVPGQGLYLRITQFRGDHSHHLVGVGAARTFPKSLQLTGSVLSVLSANPRIAGRSKAFACGAVTAHTSGDTCFCVTATV